MSWQNNTSLAKNWGIFGWNYNRANYKYDQTLRWARYTSGRKQAISQIDMFREDITDLTTVSTCKLKVYGPIHGIVTTVCVTVFVEGRSGLKFPGPPVFVSGVYLQCLCIGMCFIALAAWLLFHATMRAQMACIQLRTRLVRVPVPTQRQLDGSRKLLSTWEEQGLYDMFRIPFVMPNGADSPEQSDEEEEEQAQKATTGYTKGGIPGAAKKVNEKLKEGIEKGPKSATKVPGFTPGNPGWYEKELEDREVVPDASPSGQGLHGLEEPYFHFEALRQAQKDWWGAEAYMRVAYLYGMIHLVMAFSYWITLHNIAELAMIWCSNLGAAGLTAGVFIIFRMDVLPEYGGAFPVELGGPFVASIALGLLYSQQYTQSMMDVGRGVGILIVIMHILMCFRMYMVAKPSFMRVNHQAREAGGRLFNRSGACDAPSWLPNAFQHVMYMVAPPKTEEQLEQEQQDRDNKTIAEDPLANVDMTPWHYVRTMIFVVGIAWTVQLCGRTIELVMGERMLVSNPGAPPWTRTGQWYGWEHGPITSKHYGHLTPQRGHWAWQKGWGPQGQQELWASDIFGFHPEADAWWAEDEGPEPRVGIAGVGENTWASGRIAYGQTQETWGEQHVSTHDFLDSGGHRRLMGDDDGLQPRPLVPLALQLPALLEPDHVACSPSADGLVAVLTSSGAGALVPAGVAAGQAAGGAAPFALDGLLELGLARSVMWGQHGFVVVTGSGHIAGCPLAGTGARTSRCERLEAPPLMEAAGLPAAAMHDGASLRAAVAGEDGKVALLELVQQEAEAQWQEMGAVQVPHAGHEIASIHLSGDHLLVSINTGAAFRWALHQGQLTSPHPVQDTPAGKQRSWQSACVLPDSKIMRLASTWQHASGGAQTLRPELFL